MTARIACVRYTDLGYIARLAIAFSHECNDIVSLFSQSGQEECTWSDGDGVFVMLLSGMNVIVLFSRSVKEECTWSGGDGVFITLLSAMNIFSLFSQSGKEECMWSDGDDVSGSRVHVNW